MTHGALIESIQLSVRTSTFMMASSGEHAPNETGGMLIGCVAGATLHIVEATPPGPHAEHRPAVFTRDGSFSQAQLDVIVSASAGLHDYVGEWHSHPYPMGPSAKDVASMRRISERETYQCPHPVMLLCRRSRGGWRIDGFQWDGRSLVARPLEVFDDVLPASVPPSAS